MKDIYRSLGLAGERMGRSVVSVNPNALAERERKAPTPLFFGVKNTADIPEALFSRLRDHPDFLWLTVDKMSHLGRSVDVELVNPITYRHMTGSTSGGCVNILSGINDLCMGTDGGGSVLAPAPATSLYAFMGKGVGLAAKGEGRSTDGLAFAAGIGIIAADYAPLRKAATLLCEDDFADSGEEIRVLVPAPGNMPLPDGRDGHAVLLPYVASLPARFAVEEYAFQNPYDRTATVAELNRLFAQDRADLILSFEGPIDVYGYDETIPRAFAGRGVAEITGRPGKGLVKAANICGCSAFVIPGENLASGAVIVAAPGRGAAGKGFALADWLAPRSERPEMFERFFTRCEKTVHPWRIVE